MIPNIYKTSILGPIHSRRLGASLGVNLMPATGKVCTFDCLYCECGFNKDLRGGVIPEAADVMYALEARIQQLMAAGQPLDSITFSGNGEPTLHKDFAWVIDQTIQIRNQYCPKTKISVLSNATRIGRTSVFDALLKVDNNILKLDAGCEPLVRAINRPQEPSFCLDTVVEEMKRFKGNLIVQSMFLRGEHEGQVIDNTKPEDVALWMQRVRDIAPRQVMVYTLDRPAPEHNLQKVSVPELEAIAQQLRAGGLTVTVAG